MLGHISKHQPPTNGLLLVALFHGAKDVDNLLAFSLGLSDANDTRLVEPLPMDRAVPKVALFLADGYGNAANSLYKDYLDAYIGLSDLDRTEYSLDKIAAVLIGLQDRKGPLKTAKDLKVKLKRMIPS